MIYNYKNVIKANNTWYYQKNVLFYSYIKMKYYK